MPDPTQKLFEVGQRVMQTVRPLVAIPQLDLFPDAYRDLLLDPIEILSDTCGELVGQAEKAQSSAEPAVPSGEPSDPPAPAQSAGALSPFSWAEGVTARATGRGYDPRGGLREEASPTQPPDTPAYGPGEPSFPAQVRRTTDAPPSPFRDDPARDPGEPGSPNLTRPDASGGDPRSSAESHQLFDGEPHLRGATHPFERRPVVEEDTPGSEVSYGEPSSMSRVGESHSAQGGRRTEGWTGPEATARAGEARTQDDHPPGDPYAAPPSGEPGPAQEPPERQVSRRVDDEPTRGAPPGAAAANERDGARLITDPSRLAAMLREHVVGPQVPSGIPDDDAVHPGSEDGRTVFRSAWQKQQVSRRVDDEPARGAPPGAAAAKDRLGVEEIIERLAEEMEAEYVRTYGSSGG